MRQCRQGVPPRCRQGRPPRQVGCNGHTVPSPGLRQQTPRRTTTGAAARRPHSRPRVQPPPRVLHLAAARTDDAPTACGQLTSAPHPSGPTPTGVGTRTAIEPLPTPASPSDARLNSPGEATPCGVATLPQDEPMERTIAEAIRAATAVRTAGRVYQHLSVLAPGLRSNRDPRSVTTRRPPQRPRSSNALRRCQTLPQDEPVERMPHVAAHAAADVRTAGRVYQHQLVLAPGLLSNRDPCSVTLGRSPQRPR